MTFVSILIAWGIMRLNGNASFIQHDGWFFKLADYLRRRGDEPGAMILAVVLPLIFVFAVQIFLFDWLWGATGLIFGVAVLLYSLGRGDLRLAVNRYMDGWHRGDLQAAMHQAQTWLGCGPKELDAWRLHLFVRDRWVYCAFERWFAVVFWFALAGPLVALAYRLLKLYPQEDTASARYAQIALFWLEWIPVRLLGLTFALVGDYVSGFTLLRRHVFCLKSQAHELLGAFATAAVKLDQTTPSGECTVHIVNQEMDHLYKLLSRCVIVWMVALAALQIMR